ncbi:DUF4143 domain-containing protein, partial [bacterium]|nr:DUF4143 domain-containing protein [bacterium]
YLGEASDSDMSEWMQSYWARDVQELFAIQNRWSFVRLIELILTSSGGTFEATRFASQSELSRQSVNNYLDVLETTGVVSIVRPYSTRRTGEITRMPKVYGFDTGFVRYYSGWSEPRPEDLGILWEHYVLNELHAAVPYARPRYWRTKAGQEVDFVLPVADGALAAIECKWKAFGSHDYAGLSALRRAYPEGPTFVVGQDVARRQQRTVDGIQVQFLPIGALGDAIAALAPRA